ncbi:MAG: hypothetical protein K2X38_16540 [Gemmataceae bacterium]|nr:hypothetical protein [Gemmataceae bacterium]
MIDTPNLLTNARRFVALHAERLGVSLVHLREQLREAIAQRVATAVAEAVHSVANRVLGDGISQQPNRAIHGSQRLWEDPMEPRSRQGLQANPQQHSGYEDDDWLEDVDPLSRPQLPSSRGPRTLLASLAIAAFCSLLSWMGLDVLAKSVKELSALTNVLDAGAGILVA